MNDINPYIQMNSKAINYQDNINDPDYDPDLLLLFDVFIAEKELKINYVVKWNNPEQSEPPKYEFEIVKVKQLYLSGIDTINGVKHLNEDIQYPVAGDTTILNSADPTIVRELFKDILDKYMITLNSITTHNFKSFESNNFIMDLLIYDKIQEKINNLCCKIKHNAAYRG